MRVHSNTTAHWAGGERVQTWENYALCCSVLLKSRRSQLGCLYKVSSYIQTAAEGKLIPTHHIERQLSHESFRLSPRMINRFTVVAV